MREQAFLTRSIIRLTDGGISRYTCLLPECCKVRKNISEKMLLAIGLSS